MDLGSGTDGTIGKHNATLAESTTRIIEGATWKRQRVVEIMPAGAMVPMRAVASWRNMITPPNQAYYRHVVLGEEVGVAYSRAMDEILANPELSSWEYVLTMEHDNVIPPDALIGLIKAMEEHPEYAAISALYWTKGEGGVPQIWGDVTDPVQNYRPQAPVPGKVVECYGLGMGFVLHRMSMFRDLAKRPEMRPFWETKCSVQAGVGTQDLAFWGKVRPLGYRCAVDCRVMSGHLDTATGIVW